MARIEACHRAFQGARRLDAVPLDGLGQRAPLRLPLVGGRLRRQHVLLPRALRLGRDTAAVGASALTDALAICRQANSFLNISTGETAAEVGLRLAELENSIISRSF